MTTLTIERKRLPDTVEEDLTPDEEDALLAYQSAKRDGTLETVSLEEIWRNLNLEN